MERRQNISVVSVMERIIMVGKVRKSRHDGGRLECRVPL